MVGDASSLMAPQVRARHMQGLIADLSRLPPEDRAAILSAISSRTLEGIGAGTLFGWVPFSFDVECSRAVARHLGPQRAHDFFRSQILGAVETSLLAGFVQGAMRLAGTDPRRHLPLLGRGYDLLFRACGRLTARYEPPSSGVIELRGLPPEAMEDDYWIGSVASSFCGLSELIGFDTRVVVSNLIARECAVTLVATWQARGTTKPR